MSDDSELWKAFHDAGKAKRASNREASARLLTEAGIPFESKNNGAHLIVEGRECYIDFWPGTGKWHSRNGDKGFGVRNLLEYAK